MNRQEYIDKYIGNIDIGDKVEFINTPREYKAPLTGVIRDIFYQHSITFTVGCTDADGRTFEYHNASLGSIKKTEEK